MANDPNISSQDRADLVAYLDGELDEQSVLSLEAKIGRDPLTRAELNELKRTWELLDYLPKPAPSPNFTHRTMSQLTIQTQASTATLGSKWRPMALPVTWAAAVVIASGVGFAGVRILAPPKPASAPDAAPTIDNEALARDRRVIENRRLYEHIVSIEFLRELANPDEPDLFGDDSSGS